MLAQSNTLDGDDAIQTLRTLLSGHGDGGWDMAWKENLTPWDQNDIQPPLAEALKYSDLKLPVKGRALVPGCGRGYDAVFIASDLDYDVLGLDLSPSAIKAANTYVKSTNPLVAGRVSLLATDFFTFSVEQGEELFDLAFDYTFFCAIPTSLRSEWGQQLTKLVKPGGYLITLVFPMDGAREGGPPYSVSVECYAQALGHHWEKVLDKIPDESLYSHKGRERLAIWKKMM